MDIIARTDAGKADQFDLFASNIPHHLPVLGITLNDPIILGQRADAIYWRALLAVQGTIQNFAAGWTAWKNYERDGGAVAVNTPEMPALWADFPSSVAPGIVNRFRFVIAYVQARPTYTPAIGRLLGIESTPQAGPDLDTVQPEFGLKIAGGSGVMVGWGWGGNSQFLGQCEIAVDRDDGKGEVFLTYDTTPGYLDTAPFPPTPKKWTYRAIFRVGDQRVGLWSNPVSIVVGG